MARAERSPGGGRTRGRRDPSSGGRAGAGPAEATSYRHTGRAPRAARPSLLTADRLCNFTILPQNLDRVPIKDKEN